VRLTFRHHDVYEPCDDSFALVDALMADQAHLRELDPKLCVEVGSGSGFVITSLALMIGDHGSTRFIATDVNPTAAQATKETLEAHGVEAEAVVTDLVDGLEKHLEKSVDVLLFNPPYVPTDEEDVGGAGAIAAWAGGERGRTVIDRFLPLVDGLLSPNGWLYMVTLTTNDPQEICRIMKKQGFASRIVIQRQTEEESLQVIKFWRDVADGEKPKEERTFSSLSLKRLAFWRS
jgi:release factor glutamine methyltransferase